MTDSNNEESFTPLDAVNAEEARRINAEVVARAVGPLPEDSFAPTAADFDRLVTELKAANEELYRRNQTIRALETMVERRTEALIDATRFSSVTPLGFTVTWRDLRDVCGIAAFVVIVLLFFGFLAGNVTG